MAPTPSPSAKAVDSQPQVQPFTSSASGQNGGSSNTSNIQHDQFQLHRRRPSHRKPQHENHIHLQPPPGLPTSSPASSIYLGSYKHHASGRSSISRSSLRPSTAPGPVSPRVSVTDHQLEDLWKDLDPDLETYDVEELRDGFFDATFSKPPKVKREDILRDAELTLPLALQKTHPLSVKRFLPDLWEDIQGVFWSVLTTRAGIKLGKSFLGFFVAYVLCLVPVIRIWLGRYSYVMALSAIINHPGRSMGAQADGTISTIIGTATGLGWGACALWLSQSTTAARRGYGGILAAFLVVFIGIIAALRSHYIRMYQSVLSAGLAILYTCLVESTESVNWKKLFNYGIPWLLGQAICLLISCLIFPDAGARKLAVSLHSAFEVMQESLIIPQHNSLMLHRRLANTFVILSQAYRDLVIDMSITRFLPSDVEKLRNLMQAVIRSLLSLKVEKQPFHDFEERLDGVAGKRQESTLIPHLNRTLQAHEPNDRAVGSNHDAESEITIDIDSTSRPQPLTSNSEKKAYELAASRLSEPTIEIIALIKTSLERCHAVLMGMSGYQKYLGPPLSASVDIVGVLTKLRKAKMLYDNAEEALLASSDLPATCSKQPIVVELFLFVHPIRQAADSIENLLVKVMEMQQSHRGWRFHLPSYPWRKALYRTNAQVRHDRGGVTAGFFFQSQSQLARTMKGMANTYKPLPRLQDVDENDEPHQGLNRADTLGKYQEEEDAAINPNSKASKKVKMRYRIWLILHRAQGFEMRFALKVVLTTSLLSIPAWLSQSRIWWNMNESWWAAVFAWMMLHPRVGGNFQDLITRALCAILGAVWGGIAYGARNGDPYVMAVFAAVYMLPMIYRFTQSSHPRSGLVGCISFTVVSLGAKSADGLPSVAHIAWTRGVAFVVGIVAAVMVNWILWPFVARHELRKALAAMMIYSSIIYRGVVAKYVYYEKGEEPGEEDVERSELLEGHLREGFVRIRQLMALTRHEIRLRGPFNPLPHSALISSLEQFFEYLVTIRQSSVFFHPHYLSDNEQAASSLLAYRRDAVAAILMTLYVLAGALKGNRKVPRYMPSAAAARRRLLDHMAEIDAINEKEADEGAGQEGEGVDRMDSERDGDEVGRERRRRWRQVYSHSYSQSLTGCVKQLEMLEKYTKEIVGEQGFDPVDFNGDYELM